MYKVTTAYRKGRLLRLIHRDGELIHVILDSPGRDSLLEAALYAHREMNKKEVYNEREQQCDTVKKQ
jgi:hypothetical protein